MKEFFLLVGAVSAIVGLIILKLKLLKKHHPNAELLIRLFKTLNMDKKTQRNHSNEQTKSPVHLRPQQREKSDGRGVFKGHCRT